MIIKVTNINGNTSEIDVPERDSRCNWTDKQKKLFEDMINRPIDKHYDLNMLNRLKERKRYLKDDDLDY